MQGRSGVGRQVGSAGISGFTVGGRKCGRKWRRPESGEKSIVSSGERVIFGSWESRPAHPRVLGWR